MLTIDPTLLSVGSVWKYGPPEAHVQDTCLIHLVDKKKKTSKQFLPPADIDQYSNCHSDVKTSALTH